MKPSITPSDRPYNAAGFEITEMHTDGQFKPLINPIKDELGLKKVNYTARGQHVPEAERNNRTIAERIRSIYHNLPYKNMPRVMWIAICEMVVRQLNMFPAKGGVSEYFSPHVIMHLTPLDYEKDCKCLLGSYCQATVEDTTNSQRARTINAIYLTPMDNCQGGHRVMSLETGQGNTTNEVKILPVTDLVIKAVEALAEKQDMIGLKIVSKNKVPIPPANWTAGVAGL